jgi:hypothetical protein
MRGTLRAVGLNELLDGMLAIRESKAKFMFQLEQLAKEELL